MSLTAPLNIKNLFNPRYDRSQLPALGAANRASLGDTHGIAFLRLLFLVMHCITIRAAHVFTVLLVLKAADDWDDNGFRALIADDDAFTEMSTLLRETLEDFGVADADVHVVCQEILNRKHFVVTR